MSWFGSSSGRGVTKDSVHAFYKYIDNHSDSSNPKARYNYNKAKIEGMFSGSKINPAVASSSDDLISKLVVKWADGRSSGPMSSGELRNVLQPPPTQAAPRPSSPQRASSPEPTKSSTWGGMFGRGGSQTTPMAPSGSPAQPPSPLRPPSQPSSPTHSLDSIPSPTRSRTRRPDKKIDTRGVLTSLPTFKTSNQDIATRRQQEPRRQRTAPQNSDPYGANIRGGKGNFYQDGIMKTTTVPGVQQGKYNPRYANRPIRSNQDDENFFGEEMTPQEQIEKFGYVKYKKQDEGEHPDSMHGEAFKPDIDNAIQWARENVRPQMVISQNGKLRRAEMGERGTHYSVYYTTTQELAHFGLGVAMYFWYLKDLFVLLLIMAAIDTYNLDYFKGDEYSPGGLDARRLSGQPGVHFMMKGSATCTAATSVEAYLIGGAEGTNRAVAAAAAMQASYSSNTVPEIHNLCQIHKAQGIVNLVSLMVFFVYTIISRFFYDSMIEELDEGMQTAADYTVVVQDPPAMATDPDEWFDFFRQFGKVALVTVTLDNGLWMKKMAYIRFCRQMYKMLTNGQVPPAMKIGNTPGATRPSSGSSFFNCCGLRPPSFYLNEIKKTIWELQTMAKSAQNQLNPHSVRDPALNDPPSVCGGLCVKDIKAPLVSGWNMTGGAVAPPAALQAASWWIQNAVFPEDRTPSGQATPGKRTNFYLQDNSPVINSPDVNLGVLWAAQPSDASDVRVVNDIEFSLREVLAHDGQWDPAIQSENPANLPPDGLRCSKVFVTFMKEVDQRRALKTLKVSKLDAWFDTGSLNDKYKFNWGPPMMMKDESGELIWKASPVREDSPVLKPGVFSPVETYVVCESDIVGNAALMVRGLDSYYFSTGGNSQAFLKKIMQTRMENMQQQSIWEAKRRIQRRYRDVLLVEEAPEPTEINWDNIRWRKPFNAFLYTIFRGMMGVAIAAAVVTAFFYIIKAIKERVANRFATALAISVANVLLPPIMLAVSRLGMYWNQTLEQSVYFWKLLLSRFVTTAIINFMITDFDQMLDEDSIYRIQAILIADMITTPFIKWFNPINRFNRFWFAPRAVSDAAARSYYKGEEWQLADCYTNMLKTVFLVMFYAVLLPSGFWIAMGALFISYWVDKYMLLNRWVRRPEYGDQMSKSAWPAIVMCLVASLYMSLYFYAGWPFDFACSANNDSYGPFWHCERNSDMYFFDYFWPHVQGYMSHGQMHLVQIYRSVDTVVLILFIVGFLAAPIYHFVLDLVIGVAFEGVGDPNPTPWNDLLREEIQGYIPTIDNLGGLLLDVPLIAVQINNMDADAPVGSGSDVRNALQTTLPQTANLKYGRAANNSTDGTWPSNTPQAQAAALRQGLKPGTFGRPVEERQQPPGVGFSKPFDDSLISFKPPVGQDYADFGMLEDEFMMEQKPTNSMMFSLTSDLNGYPLYYSRVKQYVDDGSLVVIQDPPTHSLLCVCVPGDGFFANVGKFCGCTFCLLTTIAFIFLCFALALMHFCKHVDTSTVDSFEVPDTAFTDELLMANDSPHGSISVVRTHRPEQYTVQVVAINYARDLASSQSLTLFDADVYRNEYSYEEFASVTAFTEFNSRWRIFGYNVDCKNVEIMARIPQYLPSLRRVVARAAYETNVVFEMQDPYTLEIATAFESVNITTDKGDVEVKGLRTTKWGIVDIRTEIEHNSHHGVVELFNIMPNILNVQTVEAAVKMERVWMYDGGLLSVSTHKGAVNLENVVMFGHYGSIVVETHAADITITLNARYFNGAFNLQSEKGLVYIDPGQFMAYEGGAPEECSSSKAWNGMPMRRHHVPGHHSHCLQGRLGMPSGYNKLIAYSKHGSIKVQFASFVEQPPGMYV